MSQINQGTDTLMVPLPLTHPIYHILLVLAAGQQHGYGLRREIVTSTEGRMRVGSGSLYRSLDVLLTAGLIGETRGVLAADLAPRRIFRLTDLGEHVAQAETERLVHLVALAQRTPRLWVSQFPQGPQPSPSSREAPGGQLAREDV
jgi:DNA-binding PadR family transcriptional regulator